MLLLVEMNRIGIRMEWEIVEKFKGERKYKKNECVNPLLWWGLSRKWVEVGIIHEI